MQLLFFYFCISFSRLLEAAEKGETGEGRLARVAKEIQALEYVGRRSGEANGRRERGREGVKFRKGPGGQTQAVAVATSRRVRFFSARCGSKCLGDN